MRSRLKVYNGLVSFLFEDGFFWEAVFIYNEGIKSPLIIDTIALTIYWIPIAMTIKPTILEIATIPEAPKIRDR